MAQNTINTKGNNVWYLIAILSILLGTVVLFFSFISLGNYQTLTGRQLLPLAVGFELQIIGMVLVIFGKAKTC